MNKYLVSVDIEGISGVFNDNFGFHGKQNYELGKKYMLHDANAVIEGIFAQDKNADVYVRDAHGSSSNLDLERLNPKAKLISGWGNLLNMAATVEEGYKALYFVGYHAGGHNGQAVLSHTFTSKIYEILLNNKRFNEAGINALIAGLSEVPVVFFSGDDCACKDTKPILEGIEYVTVKKSLARDSIVALPLEETKELLFNGAKAATKNALENKYMPLKIDRETTCEIKTYEKGASGNIFLQVQKLIEYDPSYNFDIKNFSIRFKTDNSKDLIARFHLISNLIYYTSGNA